MADPKKPIALEDRMAEADARLRSPSAARNRDAILDALRGVLPEQGHVLEVGSGTGEHAVHIAGALTGLTWQPSDPDPMSRASISAWIAATGLDRIAQPIDLDVSAPQWPAEAQGPFQAVLSANMIHIAPWAAAEGLIAGAGRVVAPGGMLVLYGPFRRNGQHTAPSNEAFDESLRARDPDWGVRDLEVLTERADQAGFGLDQVIEMPANNFTVVFRKPA